MTGNQTLFFAPVYNQVRELPCLLEELKHNLVEGVDILLINNGSSDGSEELIRKSGHQYIEFERNWGIGYSYMAALDYALENQYELFGTIAGNGKMLPQEMDRLLTPLQSGQADYISGSRFLPGGKSPHLPLFRRCFIPAVNIFVRVVLGARLTDATCGYRAYRLDIIKRADFDWHAAWLYNYTMEYYLYAKCLLDKNIRCMEVPITMRYPGQKKPYSKIRPGIDWYRMLKPWVIARWDGHGFLPPGETQHD